MFWGRVRMFGKGKLILLAVLLAVVVVAAGCGKKQPVQQAEAGPVTVSTAKAATGLLENGTLVSGKLEAESSANVVPKVPGKVARVHVDVGSRVSAGQVLVTLENKDLADRVTQAEAGVAQAEAALAQAQAKVTQAQEVIQADQSSLASAQARFEVAEANYRRGQQLLAAGAMSQADFERYELDYKNAKDSVNQAASKLQVDQAGIQVAQAGVQQAQAGLDAARAQLALARQAYEDSFIRAPFTGVVTARNVNPGEMAATTPVVTLVNLDRVEVKAMVGEGVINQLKQGQKVQVKVSAVSEQPFEGVITSISPAADPTTKAFPIKVEIANPKNILKPGMFAEVQLPAANQKELLVPREAVVKEGEKNFVWVVQDGRVSRREIQVGESDGKNMVVTSGLSEGEEVVTAGQESLQEGAPVTVKN